MNKTIIILITICIMILPISFAVFGDVTTTYSLKENAGNLQANFKTDTGWGAVSSNLSNAFIILSDNDFNVESLNVLEHFDEVSMQDTDGAFNGTHYFVKNSDVGAYVYVYDSSFTYQTNLTLGNDVQAFAWNGSTFLGVNGNFLYDLGIDLSLSDGYIATLSTEVTGMTIFDEVLFTGDFNSPYNITNYNTSTNYTSISSITPASDVVQGIGANSSHVVISTGTGNFLYDFPLTTQIDGALSYPTSTGADDGRALSYDGTNWWILDRTNPDAWVKYDSTFNYLSEFDISGSGSNFRAGTIIGESSYAWNQDDNTIYVHNTTTGALLFSFVPSPLVDTAGNLRGMDSDGINLYINNHLGFGNGAIIAEFDLTGTFSGVNQSIDGTTDSQSFQMALTPSTQYVYVGGSEVTSHGQLERFSSAGVLLEAINYSTLGIDSIGGHGLDYKTSTNEIYLLPRFITGGSFANPNIVVVMDGGVLSVVPEVPVEETPDASTLDGFSEQASEAFAKVMITLIVVFAIGLIFIGRLKGK